jgi:hypothetical protein
MSDVIMSDLFLCCIPFYLIARFSPGQPLLMADLLMADHLITISAV